MTNYNKPYRGLPAEIRLQIWRLVVPSQVTMDSPDPVPYKPRGVQTTQPDDSPPLRSSPFAHIKLLYLNRGIYSEVLPMLKKTEIRLASRAVGTEYPFQRIKLAMQSPAFGMLNYYWNSTSPEPSYQDSFLRQLLKLDSTYSSRILNMTVAEAGRKTIVLGGGRSVHSDKRFEGRQVLALFAGAALTKGIVTERIVIVVERMARNQLIYWSPSSLRSYWNLPVLSGRHVYRDDSLLFARKQYIYHVFFEGISRSTRLDVPSHIRIDVDFVETSEPDIYTSKIVFTKIDANTEAR